MFFYPAIIAWILLAACLSLGSAVSTHRLTEWLTITITMFVAPIAMIATMVILYQGDLVGAKFAVGLVFAGAAVFIAGAFGGGPNSDRLRIGLRLAGWSVMTAPMMVSLTLSLLLPIPLLLAFFIHPRWKQYDLRLATPH